MTRRKTLLAALDRLEAETVGQPLMRLASIEVCRRELLKPRRQSPHAKRWAMDCLRKYGRGAL